MIKPQFEQIPALSVFASLYKNFCFQTFEKYFHVFSNIERDFWSGPSIGYFPAGSKKIERDRSMGTERDRTFSISSKYLICTLKTLCLSISKIISTVPRNIYLFLSLIISYALEYLTLSIPQLISCSGVSISFYPSVYLLFWNIYLFLSRVYPCIR